jgi:hypothetical protein
MSTLSPEQYPKTNKTGHMNGSCSVRIMANSGYGLPGKQIDLGMVRGG